MASVLVLTILLGRSLGPDSVGQLSLLLAAVAVLQSISIGGISGAAIHKLLLDKQSWSDSIQVIIAARFILIPSFYALGLTLMLVVVDSSPSTAIAIAIFFIGYAVGTFDVAEITKTSNGLFRQIANRRLVLIVLIAPFKLGAAAIGNYNLVLIVQGLEAALWQLVLLPGSAISLAILAKSLRRIKDGLKEIIELKSLWISSIAAVLASRADIFVVAAMLGTLMVGQYSTASRLVEAATVLAAALATVMLNGLTPTSSNSASYARRSQSSARMMLTVGVTCAAGMALAGPWLVVFLYGDEFALAADLLPLYAVSLIPIFQRQLISKFLIIEKEYAYSLWSNVLGLACNLALNFLLIPIFGIWGAVYSALSSYTIGTTIAFLPTRRGRAILSMAIGSIFMPLSKTEKITQMMVNTRRVQRAQYQSA